MPTPPMLDRPIGAYRSSAADPLASLAVALLAVTGAGLLLGAILAVYDWRTPAAVLPLFFTVLGLFGAAAAVLLIGAAVRWTRAGRG